MYAKENIKRLSRITTRSIERGRYVPLLCDECNNAIHVECELLKYEFLHQKYYFNINFIIVIHKLHAIVNTSRLNLINLVL